MQNTCNSLKYAIHALKKHAPYKSIYGTLFSLVTYEGENNAYN